MSNDVIGSRYRLGSVVTCTPEATTWDALDSWLEERVLVVTPEPGCDERFGALAGAVLDRSSAHLVGLYDIGATTRDFVVFGVPTATLSDERTPREEEDVLVAGRALGDALEALHERGVLHGDLHPGSVVLAESGDAALSPWPLAPRPYNWSGPGGFGTDPDERRDVSARDDVRALGAVLLGALAGPPVLSSQQVGNLQRELAGRAPDAVTIADRALTSPARGGYAVAAELRDDCAAVLAGQSLASPVSDLPAAGDGRATVAAGASAASEGRRAAVVLAASGAALLAGFGVADGLGAAAHPPVHAGAAHVSGCAARSAPSRCAGAERADTAADAAPPVARVPAQLADHPVAAAAVPRPAAPARVATSTPATSATAARAAAAPTTTTAPPSTTTSSTSTSTSTSTTSAAPSTTTTTTAPTTTTSTSSNVVQAGPSLGGGSWSGSGPGGGAAPGPER